MPMEHAGYQRISANQHPGYAFDMGQGGGCQSINPPYLPLPTALIPSQLHSSSTPYPPLNRS